MNRSQADINKNVDMMAARRKEREYFQTSPEYGHLAHKMGSEYLAKLLSKVVFYRHYLDLVYLSNSHMTLLYKYCLPLTPYFFDKILQLLIIHFFFFFAPH